MFDQITDDFIDLKRSQLIFLFHSLNQPQISPGPGLAAQAAEAYTAVLQTLNQQMTIYVGLFFAQTNKRVLYRIGPFQSELLEAQMTEAEAFTSQMGFLMTNLNYNLATADEKQELTRMVPFFYRDIDLYYQSLSISEIEAKRISGDTSAKKDTEADLQKLFFQQYVTMLGML